MTTPSKQAHLTVGLEDEGACLAGQGGLAVLGEGGACHVAQGGLAVLGEGGACHAGQGGLRHLHHVRHVMAQVMCDICVWQLLWNVSSATHLHVKAH